MSGFHPVASGSIPGIGFSVVGIRGRSSVQSAQRTFCVLLAQLAEHPLNNDLVVFFIMCGALAQR